MLGSTMPILKNDLSHNEKDAHVAVNSLLRPLPSHDEIGLIFDQKKSTLYFRLLFSYTDPCIQSSPNPAVRLHDSLQEVR